MADIDGTSGDDVIRTAALGGSLGGLPDATDGDDVITPGDGDDTVAAGDGDDTVVSGDGVDTLDGGDGTDTLDFTDAPGPVLLVLGQGDVFNDGHGNTETASNFEIVQGSAQADLIAGSPGPNELFGADGNDQLFGNIGDDEVHGGTGSDTLIGEEGADVLHGDTDDDVLVGGRNESVGPNGQRPDDSAIDELHGGQGFDTLILGVGDFGHGEDDEDSFEFAIDAGTPLDQQPLAVGTAVFSGNRSDYDVRVEFGTLFVEDLVGGGGRDSLGVSRLTVGAGPQVVAFLQFDDVTLDVLTDVPGITFNLPPVVESFTLTIDAGSAVATSIAATDPDGDTVFFVGTTNGPANGVLDVTAVDPTDARVSFLYAPAPGFLGTDSVDFLFDDDFDALGSGTVTFEVVFDSAVADFFQVGVGRTLDIGESGVGANDADANGDAPLDFFLQQGVGPDGILAFNDSGTFTLEQVAPVEQTLIFVYGANFADGTSNTAPVFVDFVELAEFLVGDSGDNTILGFGLDDTITGGEGDDSIDGGAGLDTAVFSGDIADYAITQLGTQVTVQDLNGADGDDGTDTILRTETLQFADASFAVTNVFNPLAGVTDGRLVTGLGGAAGFGENSVDRIDNASSAAIPVTDLFGGALDFFGQPITEIFVNENGNLTFTQPNFQGSPTALGASTSFAIIAGIWADLDTGFGNVAPSPGGNSAGTNLVYFDLDEVTQTFTATWDDVSYFSNGGSAGVAQQLQLVGRGGDGDFDIVYRFEHVDGSRAARSGFANQDDSAIFELPGSGTTAVGDLDTLVGNTGLPGVWMFSVRDGSLTPSGVPDGFATDEDTALVVAGPGVLENDSDPLGRALTAVTFTDPLNGSLALGADGAFTYTPFLDFNGNDSFQYQVATGALASGPILVNITVNGVNDPPFVTGLADNTTPENLVSGVNTGIGVTVGTLLVSDPESPIDDLIFALQDDAGGRFVLDGHVLKTAGELDFEDATFHDIVLRVTDPQGAETEQTLRIVVQNVNEGPSEIFLTGTQAIFENLPPGVFLGTLSSNDAEGDPITFTRVNGPVNIVDGEVFTSLSFDHEFQTQFTFTVRAEEASGDGVERQFTIFVDNINEPPTAVDDFVQTLQDTSLNFDVTGNDLDPENGPFDIISFTQPANGFVIDTAGTLDYTPNPGFVGFDGFSYTISDGGFESTASVSIAVAPGRLVAEGDFYLAIEEQPKVLDVLSNDFLRLPDGTQAPARVFGAFADVEVLFPPAHGTLAIFGPFGDLTYTPDPNFYGFDSFTYEVGDGFTSAFARVDIQVMNVNDDPFQTFVPEFLAVENRTLFGSFDGFQFISDPDQFNPSDVIHGFVGTVMSAEGGTVTFNVDDTFRYTPPDNFTGFDSFLMLYNDFGLDEFTGITGELSSTHFALIRINVEGEEPIAADDRHTTTVGQTVIGNVLNNDRSPPGLTPLEADQAGGSIPIAANGFFTFNANSSGTFVSTYRAVDSDGVESLDPAILKIVVLPRNPPPVPAGGIAGVGWGDPHFVTLDLLAYDFQGFGEFVLTDATSGDPFEVQIRTSPWGFTGSQVTIVETMAAQIGTHRIMLDVDGTLHVDGALTTLEAGTDPLILSGGVGLYHKADGTYVFADEVTGEQVQFKAHSNSVGAGFMNLAAFLEPSRAGTMQGILGDGDGDTANDLQLADGTVLPQPINFFDLYGDFADAWRVTDATSLFVYEAGEGTADFQVTNFPTAPVRLSDLPTAAVAAAAQIVADAGITDPLLAEAAILDLMLTGDESFIAGAAAGQDPDIGLEVFVPPTPPLVGLLSPAGDVLEGDADSSTLTFTVFRTGNALDEITVDWAVQAAGLGFTDAADHDGALPSGQVTLAIGETDKTFTLDVSGDLTPELNEEVRVLLAGAPAGYTLASATAQQTVLNDDGPVLPDAVDDSADTDEATPVVIAPLGNDSDPLGAGISVTDVGAAADGTVQQNGNLLTYTPDAGFSGEDEFTYTIALAGGGSDTATVTVNVAAAPDPNDPPVAGTDAVTTDFGTAIVIPVADVLANDDDADGDALSVTGIALQGADGVASFDAGTGEITYTPDAGFSGTDGFAYSLSDGTVTVAGLVNVTVAPVPGENDAPVANDDSASGDEDDSLTGDVLANDVDPDGDDLSAILVGGAAHGEVTLNPDGSFTYAPDDDFNGSDSFTYRANDGALNSNIATVSLTVAATNDAPVTGDDEFAIAEDNVLTVVAAAGLLLDDTDIDDDPLTAALVAGPAHGTLNLNPDGSFTYTPDADFNGPDSFTYRANDGALSSNLATVSLTVAATNDAPVTGDDEFAIAEDNVLTVAAAGLLLDDTDIDDDPLTAALVAGPAHGALTLNPDGSFSYVPNPDFNGPDSFTYKTNDGALDGNVATVALTVSAENDEPTNLALSNASIAENSANGALIGLLSATDVDGDSLAFSIVGAPGPFAVVGNQLRVNGPIDFESTPTLPLTLRASDPSGTSTQRDFTILVTDVSEGGGGPAPVPPGFAFSSGTQGNGQAPSGPTTTDGISTTSNGTFLVEATGVWNSVKNAFTAVDSYSPALGTDITIANFVDVRLDLDNSGPLVDLTLTAVGLKRGNIVTDGGDDTVHLVLHSNEGAFVNTVKVSTDGGNDVVDATTVALSGLDEFFLANNPNPANGPLWKKTYDGRFSTVDADLGTGDDTITATDVRLLAKGGAGNDTLVGGRRADVLEGGNDNDAVTGGLGADRFRFDKTDGNDTLADFSAAQGDKVSLIGGTAADLTLAGAGFTFGGTIVTAGNGHVFTAADFLFV